MMKKMQLCEAPGKSGWSKQKIALQKVHVWYAPGAEQRL